MKRFYLLTLAIASAILVNAQAGLMIKNGEKGLYLEHTVAAKEGLYAIGRLYNVSAKHLAGYNKIDLNAGISIGQTLRIPLTDTNFTQKSTSGTPIYYTVGPSEGLLKVSNENRKVSLKNLKDWNDLKSDNIQAGANLIVGFLVSKEMTAARAIAMAKKPEPPKTEVINQPESEGGIVPPAEDNSSVTKTEPVVAKTEVKEQPKPELKKEEPKREEPKREEPRPIATVITPSNTGIAPVNAVIKEEVNPSSIEGNGYFKGSFEQQTKSKPANKNNTVTSGIFKTTSGWQDAKYYLLIDNVSPGTIVKIINPANNKAVYAKVLGEMNGIRQNEGLDIRISNAAASALQITEEDKFVVKVNY